MLAILLVLCWCIGLCACGNGTSVQIEYPEGWDRIAEATKLCEQLVACRKIEDVQCIAQTGVSEKNLSAYVFNDPEIQSIEIQKIAFVESYKGCDTFILKATGHTEESLANPDSPYFLGVAFEIKLALAIENGQYVIAARDLSKRMNRYEICSFCILGEAPVYGEPCATCNGMGQMLNQNSFEHCTDCDGTGNVFVGFDTCKACDGKGVKIR